MCTNRISVVGALRTWMPLNFIGALFDVAQSRWCHYFGGVPLESGVLNDLVGVPLEYWVPSVI